MILLHLYYYYYYIGMQFYKESDKIDIKEFVVIIDFL